MQSETWKTVKALLAEVLALAPGTERQNYLDRAQTSLEIRREVESLLAVEEEAQDLMRLSAIEFAQSLFDDDEDANDQLINQQIGAYRIVRELGQGGMGAVYLATRADGKFEQKAALKLLKREMNTTALRRRFEQEREILASLEHPNIARLLDAGTTADKIPFLVMEYVEGLPITDFCSRHNLTLTARLDLFRKICETVAFAHRSLVVHRDLKPSNILVATGGVPKLLDFGISKILSTELENNSAATVTRLGVMTPAYASPEQLQNKSVTTATDVYSLGVILYELLSGHRPFETKENDLQQIYQAVCELDPPLPSALINTAPKNLRESAPAETETQAYKFGELPTAIQSSNHAGDARRTNPNRIERTNSPTASFNSNSLRGDLDNIILKALSKKPEHRYSSAENFAEDIRRHQNGLPVTARAQTFAYRAEKFIKRHRPAVFAGALILLAIIVGIAATLWQAQIAQTERLRAERRFNDVRALANSFLFEFSPKIENLPGSMPARQLLVVRALEYLDNLSKETSGDLNLQSELATAYEKVGDVQGNPDNQNVGDLKGALESYQKARDIRRKLLAAAAADDAEMNANLANNLEVAANINLNGGAYDQAGESLAEAVKLREKVIAQKPDDFAARAGLAKTLRTSGHVPFYNSEFPKANDFYQRSRQIFERLNREQPADATVGFQYANTFVDVGDAYGYMDEPKIAEENIHKGLEMLIALQEKHPHDDRVRRSLMVAYLKRAEYYRDAGDNSNSLRLYDKALETAETALAVNAGSFQAKRDVVIANKQRAVTLRTAGKLKESVESFQTAIDVSEQLKKEDPNNIVVVYDIAGSYYEMGETHFGAGEYQSAIRAAHNAHDNCQEVLAKNPTHTQSIRVTARARHLSGKAHHALHVKNGQIQSWQQALKDCSASLQIYSKLKAEGKLTGFDAANVADLERLISEINGELKKL